MGTNYYARVIPTKERKEKLKKLIDEDNFDELKALVNKTYNSPQYDSDEETFVGGEIHLGKSSGGWKFLWNPNYYKLYKGHTEWIDNGDNSKTGHWVEDGFDVVKFYELTKKSIKEFLYRKDIVIYDEYGEKQDKEEFWNMALNWGYEDGKDEGWDGESYEEYEKRQNPNRRTYDYETDYSKFIKACGFKVNKYNTDFYSDGLRFATTTDFS